MYDKKNYQRQLDDITDNWMTRRKPQISTLSVYLEQRFKQ